MWSEGSDGENKNSNEVGDGGSGGGWCLTLTECLLFVNSFSKHFTHRNSFNPHASHEAGVIIMLFHTCGSRLNISRCLK